MNENELENVPDETLEQILEPVPDQDPDLPPADPADEAQPGSPVNTGVPDIPPEPNGTEEEPAEGTPPQDEASPSGAGEEQTDGERGAGEDGETEPGADEETGGGSITHVTVIHPPSQQVIYYADEESEYHVTVDNAEDSPVPVAIMETRVETVKEPGIMEKRLEDYTVTEGLLLLILSVLVIRMLFDYGRRFI